MGNMVIPQGFRELGRSAPGYSSKGGAVGGGCSGWGLYYIVKQPIIECKPLHPFSTAPPFAECRAWWMSRVKPLNKYANPTNKI